MPIPSDSGGVDRTLLRDDVYGRIRDAIVDGTFAPGEQLKDAELAAWLGVSRTPIREALLRLASSGLVVAQPGRSTTVSRIDERTIRDARDVVAAMHELAVREGIGRIAPADLERMREANERFALAVDAGDADAALHADDELHAVLVHASGNRALSAVLEQFTPVVRRAERLRFASSEARAAIERHDRLIAQCAAGDADAAAALTLETWRSLPAS